jgi:MerR family transcriptional regulator, heat shock protein HspR
MKLIHIHCHTDLKERLTTCSLDFHPDLLAAYQELGIVELENNQIDVENLRRLQKVVRLKRNLGVNTIGASIIVDLLDQIESLQDEINSLRRK